MLNILYLTKNISQYKAANYQLEFINALGTYANVLLYGPGYDNFLYDNNIRDVLMTYKSIDVIFVGHEWLNNGSGDLDPMPKLGLAEYNDLPIYVFINKEYTRLNEKLKWISNVKPKAVFTHHWNMKLFKDVNCTNFKFVPFACDTTIFVAAKNKKYDLSFSGVLQNKKGSSVQSDFRIKILNELFFTFFDIPLFKKRKYKNFNIFWNSIPRTRFGFYLSVLLKKYRRMSLSEYASVVNNSVYYLNSMSPIGLVSPRYYECMAANAKILSEHNEILNTLIGDNNIRYISSQNQLYEILNDRDDTSAEYYNMNRFDLSWDARASNVLNDIEIDYKKSNTI